MFDAMHTKIHVRACFKAQKNPPEKVSSAEWKISPVAIIIYLWNFLFAHKSRDDKRKNRAISHLHGSSTRTPRPGQSFASIKSQSAVLQTHLSALRDVVCRRRLKIIATMKWVFVSLRDERSDGVVFILDWDIFLMVLHHFWVFLNNFYDFLIFRK